MFNCRELKLGQVKPQISLVLPKHKKYFESYFMFILTLYLYHFHGGI